MDDSGHFQYVRDRNERYAAFNGHRMSHSALKRVFAQKPSPRPKQARQSDPAPWRRFSPKSFEIVSLAVQRVANVTREGILGTRQNRELVDARFCIAVLACEFAPHLSAAAIDEAMLRGSGCAIWYRARHLDRIKLYPEYGELHARCRLVLGSLSK